MTYRISQNILPISYIFKLKSSKSSKAREILSLIKYGIEQLNMKTEKK